MGSNPIPIRDWIAQLVEHYTSNVGLKKYIAS
jgi:hypothetical protein